MSATTQATQRTDFPGRPKPTRLRWLRDIASPYPPIGLELELDRLEFARGDERWPAVFDLDGAIPAGQVTKQVLPSQPEAHGPAVPHSPVAFMEEFGGIRQAPFARDELLNHDAAITPCGGWFNPVPGSGNALKVYGQRCS